MPGPLAGVRVLDLTRALAGPYCSMMLGDMGADVLKVEMPKTGDEARAWGPPFINGESGYFLSVNRNKKGMTLNLKDARGKEILAKLMARADVVLQNFSPGTLEKLGFPYDRMKALNPRLVYCAISGFGQSGPSAGKAAYDQILQGLGGLMSITGPVGGPPIKVGVPIADIASGMFAAYAVMVALFHRERTGQGQMIDTSLLDGQVALLTFQAQRYFLGGKAPGWGGNCHPLIAPYELFQTKDSYINVAVGNDSLWARFCHSLELEQYVNDPRFKANSDRLANRDALIAIIEERFSRSTTAEIAALLDGVGVPSGAVHNLAEVFADPQVAHLGLEQVMQHPTVGELRQTGLPYRFSESRGALRLPPPLLGQHTDEVLQGLGYAKEEIGRLRQEGVV
ncbi:MAG: CaiB/BaiF CoA transferase family protein [Candidatus Methylomirabilales bacterium]